MSKYNFILNKEQNDSYILENVKGIKRQTLNRCQTEIHFYPLKHPSHLMQLTERTLLTHHEELLIALTILISRTGDDLCCTYWFSRIIANHQNTKNIGFCITYKNQCVHQYCEERKTPFFRDLIPLGCSSNGAAAHNWCHAIVTLSVIGSFSSWALEMICFVLFFF